jgi:hypothetical protein
LRGAGVGFKSVDSPAGSPTEVHVGGAVVPIADGDAAKINTDLRAALTQAGYPATAAETEINWPLIALGLVALVVAATALYGPQAAALVELFPTNVRYTALSVPYHVGVGWVGGFMPFFGVALVAATGDLFAGLWYLVFFSAIAFVTCIFLFPETRGRPLN